MDKTFIKALAAAALIAGAFSQAHAKGGADDGAAPDRKGKGQDTVLKRHGADDPTTPPDIRRGRGKDDGANHKRQGADDPTSPPDSRRGRGTDDGANHKRHGADDPVSPPDKRRGRGADDPVGHK